MSNKLLKEIFEGQSPRDLILGKQPLSEEKMLWSIWDTKAKTYILSGKHSDTEEDAVKDMVIYLGSKSPDVEYPKMLEADFKKQKAWLKKNGFIPKQVHKSDLDRYHQSLSIRNRDSEKIMKGADKK